MNEKTKNLQNLLKLVKELSSRDDMEWFKNDLKNHFKISEPNGLSKIEDIYEYCIKKIIEQQANQFYSNFKIDELKLELIEDFIRMEQFKREDRFEEFCVSMHQQIENITLYLFEKFKLKKIIEELQDVSSLLKYGGEKGKFVFNDNSIALGRFIFMKFNIEKYPNFKIDNTTKWYYNNKLRAVLYYLYFDQKIVFNSNSYDNLYNLGNNLYLMRNKVHRGPNNITERQKIVYDKIIPNHNKYYFKFLGFLEDFVSKINENLK